MRRKQFEREVQAALRDIPEAWAAVLAEVAILAADEPDPAQRGKGDLFGVFEGASLAERTAGFAYDPPRITIFRKPLERAFPTRRQRRMEIRRTVIHEVAHYIGAEERDMPGFGLE
jgi:predicted Zn-dependent protease with MMP-like domain